MFQIITSTAAIAVTSIYALYTLVKRERTAASWALSAALSVTAFLELFDLLAFIFPDRMFYWKNMALFAEGALPFSWLLFSITFARQNEIRAISLPYRIILALALPLMATPLLVPVRTMFYSPDFGQERILFLDNLGYAFYLVLLVYMVIALINLETTLSNASRGARWGIKFEILGTGSLLAALIFYYSQGFLYRTINMNLMPVRTVALLLAVTLTAYSQLWRAERIKIQISRNLAYKSVVLLVVGLYLVALGLVGEGMKYFGESFQRSLAIAIAFAVGLGFLTILLSDTIKRKITVFLNRNFYQDKYDYRSQWLQFTARLSSAKTGDELLSGILAGYCDTFGMGCGALFLTDNTPTGFSLAAKLETDPRCASFSGKDPLVECLLASRRVFNLNEDPAVPGQSRNELLKGNEGHFAVPLFLDDRLDGFILLGRPLNKNETYGDEDFDLMLTLAHQASSAVLNLRLSDQLAKAKEMEVLGKISAFVVHDLKNLVYTISLILDNAGDYITEPEFQQDMLASLDNTVKKMQSLIAKLKYLPEKKGLSKKPADLLQLARETAATITGAAVQVDGDPIVAEIDRDEIQKVVLNLILNAVDATDGKGPVLVEVGGDELSFVRVKDEGCGIPEHFLRRDLFSPFKSTKKNGLGIGLYQCKQIVEAHGGSIDVDSEVGRGTAFTVWLPLKGGDEGIPA